MGIVLSGYTLFNWADFTVIWYLLVVPPVPVKGDGPQFDVLSFEKKQYHFESDILLKSPAPVTPKVCQFTLAGSTSGGVVIIHMTGLSIAGTAGYVKDSTFSCAWEKGIIRKRLRTSIIIWILI